MFFLLVIMLPLLLGYSTLIRRSLQQLKQLYAKQREHDRQVLMELNVERSRIGRDLHDGPLKENVFMQQAIDFCDSFIQAGDLAAAQSELQRLSDIVSHQADAIRALTGRLRPLELNAHGLAGAIQLLPVKLDRKLDIRIKNSLTEELKPELEGVIYYIIREALINASLHANPRCVRVALGRRDYTIYGEVRDDGDGFDIMEAKQRAESSGHHGLSSMQERLDLIGGTIKIESVLGRGTTVAFTIPIGLADIEIAGRPVNQENSPEHSMTSQFAPNL